MLHLPLTLICWFAIPVCAVADGSRHYAVPLPTLQLRCQRLSCMRGLLPHTACCASAAAQLASHVQAWQLAAWETLNIPLVAFEIFLQLRALACQHHRISWLQMCVCLWEWSSRAAIQRTRTYVALLPSSLQDHVIQTRTFDGCHVCTRIKPLTRHLTALPRSNTIQLQ